MKNIFGINLEINNKSVKAIWYNGAKAQEIYALLLNFDINVDAFCVENMQYDSFLGKDVVTVIELISKGDFALMLDVESYDLVLNKYEKYGLKEEDLYVYINPSRELIYV